MIYFPAKVTESDCAQLCTPCDAAAVSREKPRPSWLQRPLPSVCTLMQLTRLPLTLMQSHNFAYGLRNLPRYELLSERRVGILIIFIFITLSLPLPSSVLRFQLGCISHLNISSVCYFIDFTFSQFSHFSVRVSSNFKLLNFSIQFYIPRTLLIMKSRSALSLYALSHKFLDRLNPI